jgi:hypothetical protein
MGVPKDKWGCQKANWGLMTNDIWSKVIACEQLGVPKDNWGAKTWGRGRANGVPKGKWGLITNDIWSKAIAHYAGD